MGSSARVVLCHTVLGVRLPCRAEALLTQHTAWHGIAPNRRNDIADIGEPHHTSHAERAHDVPKDTLLTPHMASRSGNMTAFSARCDLMHYFGMRSCAACTLSLAWGVLSVAAMR
jgi:hypothetical protein